MIERPRREFEVMRSVEDQLWWYRVRDKLVVNAIRKRFPDRPPNELRILDAGCGTGGLMRRLAAHGMTSCEGFDLSDAALELATESGLSVTKLNLSDGPEHYKGKTFDAIVSNDVLYYLPPSTWSSVLDGYRRLLSERGVMIMNLAAAAKYRGIHDVAVGLPVRIEPREFKTTIAEAEFVTRKQLRWPTLLAPAIYATRAMQRRQLKAGIDPDKVESDVKPINPVANAVFYGLARFGTWIPWPSAGSSVFYVLERKA